MAKSLTAKLLQDKDVSQLNKMLSERREHARQLHFDMHIGSVKNTQELKTVKREIARIMTAISQKQK